MILQTYPHKRLSSVSMDVHVTGEPTMPHALTEVFMKLGKAPDRFSLSESKTQSETVSCATVGTTERIRGTCSWLPTRYVRRIHSGRHYSLAAGPVQSGCPDTTAV